MSYYAGPSQPDPQPNPWHAPPAQGHGPQPPYQPYYGPAPYLASAGTNGLAVASLVLGILWIYWLGSILAVIFGHVAVAQITRRHQAGRGLAIAGLVLGWIGVGFLILTIALGAAASSA